MKISRFLAVSLMIICIISTGCGKSEKEISFGTAGIGGKYYAYATAMADMISIDNSEYRFDIKNTNGSEANLRLLNEQFLDIAIVQSDILAEIGGERREQAERRINLPAREPRHNLDNFFGRMIRGVQFHFDAAAVLAEFASK